MTSQGTKDDPEPIPLHSTSEAEYCQAATQKRKNEFWWYFNGLAPYKGFSKPFMDKSGRWWFCVKPRFAWPVDYFTSRPPGGGFPKLALLGCQWPVSEKQEANSFVHFNVIRDLRGYGIETVARNKRRAIRKGLRSLDIRVVNPADKDVAAGACEVWNSHVERTDWNSAMSEEEFRQSWAELSDSPGTTVLVATEKEPPHTMCSWLIARIIDSVIYVDTIASHTERLRYRPNDAAIFMALVSAEAQGVTKAHYSLKSNIESLERFKVSLGFEPYAFPSRLKLRGPVKLALMLFMPNAYKRLQGREDWAD